MNSKSWKLDWIDHGPCLCFLILKNYGVRFGWGYDKDLPLSYKPKLSKKPTSHGHSDRCFACFGFYVGISKKKTNAN